MNIAFAYEIKCLSETFYKYLRIVLLLSWMHEGSEFWFRPELRKLRTDLETIFLSPIKMN
jgi:hypothetical protein